MTAILMVTRKFSMIGAIFEFFVGKCGMFGGSSVLNLTHTTLKRSIFRIYQLHASRIFVRSHCFLLRINLGSVRDPSDSHTNRLIHLSKGCINR